MSNKINKTSKNSSNNKKSGGISEERIIQLIQQISDRKNEKFTSINEIWENRLLIPDLSIYLWHSSGLITSLLIDLLSFQENIFNNSILTNSDRIISILRLFYIISEDEKIKNELISNNIIYHLLPFFDCYFINELSLPIIASLFSIISSLVKESNYDNLKYLINNNFLNILYKFFNCLNLDLKNVSLYIFYKFLLNNNIIKKNLLNKFENISLFLHPLLILYQYNVDNYSSKISNHLILIFNILINDNNINLLIGSYFKNKILKNSFSKDVDSKYIGLTNHFKDCIHKS